MAAQPADVPGGDPIPVLIVDDDASIRKMLRLMLEDAGYPVLEATDGMQALDILHTHSAPLITITNQHMTRLDGPDLLRQVLDEPALVAGHAYVFMTAERQMVPPALQQILDTLHARVLFKPFGIRVLLAAIAEAALPLRPPETDEADGVAATG